MSAIHGWSEWKTVESVHYIVNVHHTVGSEKCQGLLK